MFNPFAPNRTRGRFAFSWDVVVHTATWPNAICATGAATPSPVSLQSPHSPQLYTYTVPYPAISYTFPFHPPTLGPPVVCLLVACQNVLQALSIALRLFKMLLGTVASSLLLAAFAILGEDVWLSV
jgi:hypothetical protein